VTRSQSNIWEDFYMKTSYKLCLTLSAAFLAVSAVASAADIAKGSYQVDGYTTSASGSLCASAGLAKGTASASSVIYPGAGGLKMILASPYTMSTGAKGSAATNVCVATTKVPAKGLDGAALTFDCYDDTVKGPAAKQQATLKATFNVGASHSPSVDQVTVTSKIYLPGGLTPICTFSTDSTYVLQ
jgi:hypothetical protein